MVGRSSTAYSRGHRRDRAQRWRPKQAQLLGDMAFEGGRIIRERIATYNIQCDLKDGGVFAANTPKHMKHLEAQKKMWERYGHTQLELMDATAHPRSRRH